MDLNKKNIIMNYSVQNISNNEEQPQETFLKKQFIRQNNLTNKPLIIMDKVSISKGLKLQAIV